MTLACLCCGRSVINVNPRTIRPLHLDCWTEHHSDPTEDWPPGHVCSLDGQRSSGATSVRRDEFSAERRAQIIEALSWWEDEDGRWGHQKAGDILHAHEVEWCGCVDGTPDAD